MRPPPRSSSDRKWPPARYVQSSVLIGACLLLLRAPALADPRRLEPRVAPACVVAARELGPRVERSLGGFSPRELEASVAIDALAAGYRVTIALRDSEQTRGTTTIDAPTCEEAVDAAAVVLALAWGKMKTPEERAETEPTTSSASESPRSPVPERRRSTVSERPRSTVGERPRSTVDERPRSTVGERRSSIKLDDPSRARGDRRAVLQTPFASGARSATRLAFAAGVDNGMLPRPTLTIAGSVARSFGELELAAIARYGLPIAEEVVETDFAQAQRHDFAGLELRGCRGLGQAVRFSACAGTEVDAVRARRALVVEDRSELETDQVSGRLSGTLAALVAHRGGLIEPGLELSGAAVAVGREAGARWLSLRVAAGAAIAF